MNETKYDSRYVFDEGTMWLKAQIVDSAGYVPFKAKWHSVSASPKPLLSLDRGLEWFKEKNNVGRVA